MPLYRLFLLNPKGQVFSSIDLEGKDDHDVVLQAKRHDTPNGAEIWQSARKVAIIEPSSTIASRDDR